MSEPAQEPQTDEPKPEEGDEPKAETTDDEPKPAEEGDES